jgi:hypothetical protein
MKLVYAASSIWAEHGQLFCARFSGLMGQGISRADSYRADCLSACLQWLALQVCLCGTPPQTMRLLLPEHV